MATIIAAETPVPSRWSVLEEQPVAIFPAPVAPTTTAACGKDIVVVTVIAVCVVVSMLLYCKPAFVTRQGKQRDHRPPQLCFKRLAFWVLLVILIVGFHERMSSVYREFLYPIKKAILVIVKQLYAN